MAHSCLGSDAVGDERTSSGQRHAQGRYRRDVVEEYCNACNSLDYLNRPGWHTEVNKMITSYGAPIGPADAKIIVDYLATNYGRGD